MAPVVVQYRGIVLIIEMLISGFYPSLILPKIWRCKAMMFCGGIGWKPETE
jgi:hypothetical protein